MRSLFVSIFLLGACGGGDGSLGGDDEPGGETCGALIGSCNHTDGDACEEFDDGWPESTTRDACNGETTVWSEGNCSRTNATGVCIVPPAGSLGCHTLIFRNPLTREQGMQVCAQYKGTFSDP